MKEKATQIILGITAIVFMLLNIWLLYLNQQYRNQQNHTQRKIEHLENRDFMFDLFKDGVISRFLYDAQSIGESRVYWGSDSKTLYPLRDISEHPKLVIGINQNMCRPCIEGAFAEIKKVFPDFESNPNIICIADIEERFKDDYYGKRVMSFAKEELYPLYTLKNMPHFFILDEDHCVKMLFITDKTAPELTKEYLEVIKDRYKNI